MGITLASIQSKVNKKRGIKKATTSSSLTTVPTSSKKPISVKTTLSSNDKILTDKLRKALTKEKSDLNEINDILQKLINSNPYAVVAIEKIIKENNENAFLFKNAKFWRVTELSDAFTTLSDLVNYTAAKQFLHYLMSKFKHTCLRQKQNQNLLQHHRFQHHLRLNIIGKT